MTTAARASVPARLAGAELKALSAIDPARVARAIGSSWAVLAAAVAVALTTSHWSVVLVAAIVVGNRQNALFLLVHEASHLLFSRDRAWNDRVANWTCAYPIGITVERYREVHLGSPITRTVLTGAVGRVVLAPVLFFYHHEHHLHPSVPFYRLPDLHRRLLEGGHYDEPPPVLAPSYTQTLAALAHGEIPPPPR